MRSTSESPSHPLIHDVSHQSWIKRSGVQVLYLHGAKHAANVEAAEQVALAWTTRSQDRKLYAYRPFMFMFSATDPARKAIRQMFAANMLQGLMELHDSRLQDCMEAQVLEDMLELHHTWTDEAVCTALEWAVTWSTPYILLDMDECISSSRMKFWSFLAGIARNSEGSLRILVTSKRPGSLLQELREFPEIHFDEYKTSNPPDGLESSMDPDYQDAMVRRLCPRKLGEARIRKCFEKLAKMSRPALEEIVGLLSSTTRWPEVVSHSNLTRFCKLLEGVSYDSTASTALPRVLASVDDHSGLQWILGWLLCAYRPFQIGELATILCYAPARLERLGKSPPSNNDIQTARMDLEAMLVGMVSWCNNRIELSSNISSLMDQDDERIWSRLRSSAAETTLKFLLEYLQIPSTQKRLDELFLQYQSRIEAEGVWTPALVPDEQGDLIFYAVQALPHHLGEAVSTASYSVIASMLKDPNGEFSPWSRVYWALSNPFSRPSKGPFSSAWRTLRRANIDSGVEFDADEMNGEGLPIDAAAVSGMDHLVDAVRANKENSALQLAQQLVDHAEIRGKAADSAQESTISWPPALLWGSTWLNMHRLMGFLLSNGADVNDKSSSLSPSLLYAAARLGYSEMVALFLR